MGAPTPFGTRHGLRADDALVIHVRCSPLARLRPSAVALAILVAGAAQAVPGPALASAGPAPVAVESVLAHQIAAIRGHDGGVPVLLPSALRLARPAYGARGAHEGSGYQLVIGSTPGCDGANVCVLADFQATRRARAYGIPDALADGIQGRYSAAHCAGDCTPATIGWVEHRVLYTIAARPLRAAGAVRATLVAAADQAIVAGPG